MKLISFLVVTSLTAFVASAQSYSSLAEIVTVYSQNGQFYLRSTPYDNESPSLPGITQVFAKGSTTPLYSIPRSFDSVTDESNNLVLSNDGMTILYLIGYGADENNEDLKSILILRNGKIFKSYTASEITGCDLEKERCSLEYDNFDDVVDEKLSNLGTRYYKKVFKAGVSEQERFLSDYAIFASDDVVYVTDSKKRMHRFGLAEGKHLDSRPFSDVYESIKSKGRSNVVELKRFDAPMFGEFPKLRSGADTVKALGATLKMVPYNIYGSADEKFKKYSFSVDGYLFRDGTFQLTDIDLSDDLPKEQIETFFKTNKFATATIPSVVDRWFLKEKIFFLRKADTKLAIQERNDEIVAQRDALKKRLVAEFIGGRYIPKDLGDAFLQLDKELPEIARNEMKALAKRGDMIQYHLGLGMWMRNNWGLWGGSRLQKYFTDRGTTHPDNMSSVVLFYYWHWLQGEKEKWKEWEQNPKQELY